MARTSILDAGTHLGACQSTNGGSFWTRSESGLPPVEITDIYSYADSTLTGVLLTAAVSGNGTRNGKHGSNSP